MQSVEVDMDLDANEETTNLGVMEAMNADSSVMDCKDTTLGQLLTLTSVNKEPEGNDRLQGLLTDICDQVVEMRQLTDSAKVDMENWSQLFNAKLAAKRQELVTKIETAEANAKTLKDDSVSIILEVETLETKLEKMSEDLKDLESVVNSAALLGSLPVKR